MHRPHSHIKIIRYFHKCWKLENMHTYRFWFLTDRKIRKTPKLCCQSVKTNHAINYLNFLDTRILLKRPRSKVYFKEKKMYLPLKIYL